MGKQKYIQRVEELFNKSPVVSFNSIKRITQEKKKTNYSKLLVSNMIKQGKIKKLSKGFYTKYNEINLAVFCFKPAYLGLQSSLSINNIWEQETIPVILTTKKVRNGIRKIMGNNVLVRKIDNKYFFGFESVREGDLYFPYSDIEKTFIDFVVFNEKISTEVLKKIKSKINKKKLNDYLKIYSDKTRKKVLKLLNFK